MTRAVLDVNVLVSGFPAPGGTPAVLIERWLRREDDLVLATAVAGNVSHLVTGDRGLLRLGGYAGFTILTPRDFLSLLEQQAADEASTP